MDDISFKVKEGEILGLLGPNGAGKTTTMRILTGFMPPTSGTATIGEFDIQQESMQVRELVGYMPERVPTYPDMTVEGFITFWAKMRGVKKPIAKVEAILERVQLIDRRKSLIRNLSKGMRQRLGLAQALVHDPRVVILDEPTIGIDPQQVIEVRDTVRDLARDHTVIFSTHILSEAEQVCDRVVILNHGQILAEGTPDKLRQQLQRGAQHLFVQIEGSPNGTEALLNSVTGVQSVEPLGLGFTVRAKPGVDVRAHIAKRIAKEGRTLLELRPVAMTLEDIFLDVVGKDDGR
ncbi:MAG: ABC transporter ATP-binding protein [Aggregatilineales bacterium]